MKKSILFAIMLFFISACGTLQQDVNLTKTGELYTTDDGVSFYYPKDYEVTVSGNINSVDNVKMVEFTKDDNTLYFTVVNDQSDNMVSDKDELYTGLLEQGQASNIEVMKPVVDSGLDVYEYIYEDDKTGIKSKEIVYFLEDVIYIYGYRSIKDVFNENEEDMTVYLESFSMNAGK